MRVAFRPRRRRKILEKSKRQNEIDYIIEKDNNNVVTIDFRILNVFVYFCFFLVSVNYFSSRRNRARGIFVTFRNWSVLRRGRFFDFSNEGRGTLLRLFLLLFTVMIHTIIVIAQYSSIICRIQIIDSPHSAAAVGFGPKEKSRVPFSSLDSKDSEEYIGLI